VFRTLSGRIDVLINGACRRASAASALDQFVVDLGPGDIDVAEGDDAYPVRAGHAGEHTAQDWAELLGTINYEWSPAPRRSLVRTAERRRAKVVDR